MNYMDWLPAEKVEAYNKIVDEATKQALDMSVKNGHPMEVSNYFYVSVLTENDDTKFYKITTSVFTTEEQGEGFNSDTTFFVADMDTTAEEVDVDEFLDTIILTNGKIKNVTKE